MMTIIQIILTNAQKKKNRPFYCDMVHLGADLWVLFYMG